MLYEVITTIGESVGFFRFESSVAADACRRCETYELNGLADSPHEEVIRDLLMEHPERFAFEDITGLPWLELDFPEDIFRAEQEVLPAIRKDVITSYSIHYTKLYESCA